MLFLTFDGAFLKLHPFSAIGLLLCFYVFGPWLNSINGLFCFVTVDVNYFLLVMLVLIGCNLFILG